MPEITKGQIEQIRFYTNLINLTLAQVEHKEEEPIIPDDEDLDTRFDLDIRNGDYQPIANWLMPNYQPTDERFVEIEIETYHMNGIKSVEIIQNNDTTYHLVLNTNSYYNQRGGRFHANVELADGLNTFTAVITSTDDKKTILEGSDIKNGITTLEITKVNEFIDVYADPERLGQSIEDCLPLFDIANGRIPRLILTEGVWEFEGPMRTLFEFPTALIITGEGEVLFQPQGDRVYQYLKGKYLTFNNISFDHAKVNRFVPYPGSYVLFDDCTWFSSEGNQVIFTPATAQFDSYSSWASVNCVYHDTLFGPQAHVLVRNTRCFGITGEVFTQCHCVVDSSVTGTDGSILENVIHTDVIQLWDVAGGKVYNKLFSGINIADSFTQQIFLRTGGGALYHNIAFANLHFEIKQGESPLRPGFQYYQLTRDQMFSEQRHVLFMDVFSENSMVWRTDGAGDEAFKPNGLLLSNCQFPSDFVQAIEGTHAFTDHSNFVNNGLFVENLTSSR